MATPRASKFSYQADDQISVLPSDDAAELGKLGVKPLTDMSDPTSIHDNCLVLSEVIKSAIEIADALSDGTAEADPTSSKHIGDVLRLLRQADGLVSAAEAVLSSAREEHENAPDSRAVLGRVLAKRKPTGPT